jgi:hypothetical protein
MTTVAPVLFSNPENTDPTYSQFGSSRQQDSHFRCPTHADRDVLANVRHKQPFHNRSLREAQSGRGHGFTPEGYHKAQNLPGRILRSTSSGLSLPAMCSPSQNASSEPTARSYGLRGD